MCAVIDDPRGQSALEEAVAIVGGYHDAYCHRRLTLWLTTEVLCGLGLLGSASSLFWVPQVVARRTGNVSYASEVSVLLVVLAAGFVRAGRWAAGHRRRWKGQEHPPIFPSDAYERFRRRRLAASLVVEVAALVVVLSPIWALVLFLSLGTASLGMVLLGDACLLVGALGAIPALRRARHRRRSWQV